MGDELDATQIFMAKERQLFKQMFPASRRTSALAPKNERQTQSSSNLPSTSDAGKFDALASRARENSMQNNLLSLSSENQELKAKLASEQAAAFQWKLNSEQNNEKVSNLINEVKELKKQLIQKDRALDSVKNDSMSSQLDTESNLSQLRYAAQKLYNYHIREERQLEAIRQILVKNKLWNFEVREEIRKSYADLQVLEVSDNVLNEFSVGSALDYQGCDSVDVDASGSDSSGDDCDELTTGSRFQHKITNDSIHLARMRGNSGPRRVLSPILSEGSRFEESTNMNDISEATSVCDMTLNTVDFENIEKIDRLEAENSKLKQLLYVAQSHAKSALLYREQKADVESKYSMLNKKFDEMMHELCSLRDGIARNVFGSEENRNSVDNVIVWEKKARELSAIVETLRKQEAEQASKLQEVEQRLTQQVMDLQRELAEAKERLQTTHEDYPMPQGDNDNKETIPAAIAEEKEKSPPLTDAGDTTQIFHVRMNPALMAHLEYKQKEEEERERKRKLAETPGYNEELEAKRAKYDERITQLEEQLRRAEASKIKAVEIQQTMTRRYREVCTALTGFQIKMRNEEWYVASCFGEAPDDAFTFKYEDGNLMLISRDDGISDKSAVKWKQQLDRYLGELHSVPAFLACVTTQLAASCLEEEPRSQPTFSVLEDSA